MVISYQRLALFLDSDQHCINKINLPCAWFIITTHILMWAGIPGLRAGLSGDHIRLGARLSILVQTGPRAHPASYTMGTGCLPGVKWLRRGVDHPPPSSAEVQERAELYLFSPFGRSWPVPGWTISLPLPESLLLPLPKSSLNSVFISLLNGSYESKEDNTNMHKSSCFSLSALFFLTDIWTVNGIKLIQISGDGVFNIV